jgi:hypothetical protein
MGYGRTAVITLLPLLLAGCINSNPGYPENSWPARITQNGCASIAGRYSNRGEMVPNNYKNYVPELAPFFIETTPVPEYESKYGKADSVVLTIEKDTLTVQVMAGDAILRSDVFSEKNKTLICKPEGAIIRDRSGWAKGNGNVLAGVEYSSYTLMSAEDHSLIIKSKSGATGLVFMLIPATGSQTNWYRFPRFRPQTTTHP